MFVAEAFIPSFITNDPTVGGVHLFSAFIGTFVAVIADWAITQVRRPGLVHTPEPLVGTRPTLRAA